MSARGTKRPNFFIVGAYKCGTTALYEYLAQHPEIFMSRRKEPSFFGQDLRLVRLRRKTEAEYLELFAGADRFPLVGEASAVYLQSKCAPFEIKEFTPGARIVIMLRDPIEMMYSLHAQTLWNGHEDIVDFEEALRAEGSRAVGHRIPSATSIVEHLLYRECATLSPKVERYFRVFGREKVHVIIYDDFKRDSRQAYHHVLDFLGATRVDLPDYPVVNAGKMLRIGYLRRMTKKVGSAETVRSVVKAMLPQGLYRSLGRGLLSLEERINARQDQRPPLPRTLERHLRESFRIEVEALSDLVGRDLTHWSRGE